MLKGGFKPGVSRLGTHHAVLWATKAVHLAKEKLKRDQRSEPSYEIYIEQGAHHRISMEKLQILVGLLLPAPRVIACTKVGDCTFLAAGPKLWNSLPLIFITGKFLIPLKCCLRLFLN